MMEFGVTATHMRFLAGLYLKELREGKIDAIVWRSTPEIESYERKMHPDRNQIFCPYPHPSELTNA